MFEQFEAIFAYIIKHLGLLKKFNPTHVQFSKPALINNVKEVT